MCVCGPKFYSQHFQRQASHCHKVKSVYNSELDQSGTCSVFVSLSLCIFRYRPYHHMTQIHAWTSPVTDYSFSQRHFMFPAWPCSYLPLGCHCVCQFFAMEAMLLLPLEQQSQLCGSILGYIGCNGIRFQRFELLRETIRNILSVTGLRPSMKALATLWCLITSAQNSSRNGETSDNFWYQEIDIASCAPNGAHRPLTALKPFPWSSNLLESLPQNLSTLREFMDVSGIQDGQIVSVIEDCYNICLDLMVILEV